MQESLRRTSSGDVCVGVGAEHLPGLLEAWASVSLLTLNNSYAQVPASSHWESDHPALASFWGSPESHAELACFWATCRS